MDGPAPAIIGAGLVTQQITDCWFRFSGLATWIASRTWIAPLGWARPSSHARTNDGESDDVAAGHKARGGTTDADVNIAPRGERTRVRVGSSEPPDCQSLSESRSPISASASVTALICP